jgi:hypothetical protein
VIGIQHLPTPNEPFLPDGNISPHILVHDEGRDTLHFCQEIQGQINHRNTEDNTSPRHGRDTDAYHSGLCVATHRSSCLKYSHRGSANPPGHRLSIDMGSDQLCKPWHLHLPHCGNENYVLTQQKEETACSRNCGVRCMEADGSTHEIFRCQNPSGPLIAYKSSSI